MTDNLRLDLPDLRALLPGLQRMFSTVEHLSVSTAPRFGSVIREYKDIIRTVECCRDAAKAADLLAAEAICADIVSTLTQEHSHVTAALANPIYKVGQLLQPDVAVLLTATEFAEAWEQLEKLEALNVPAAAPAGAAGGAGASSLSSSAVDDSLERLLATSATKAPPKLATEKATFLKLLITLKQQNAVAVKAALAGQNNGRVTSIDSLKVWGEWSTSVPLIAKWAETYLPKQPTQTPSERCFNVMKVANRGRESLEPHRLEHTVMTALNYKQLVEAVPLFNEVLEDEEDDIVDDDAAAAAEGAHASGGAGASDRGDRGRSAREELDLDAALDEDEEG